MTTKTTQELEALAFLYRLQNGKNPEKKEDINLETLNIPKLIEEKAGSIVMFLSLNQIEFVIRYLGKHIQDCYDYDAERSK